MAILIQFQFRYKQHSLIAFTVKISPKLMCLPFPLFPLLCLHCYPNQVIPTLAKHRILFRFRAFCLFLQSSRLVTVRLRFFPGKTSSSSRFSNSFSTATAASSFDLFTCPEFSKDGRGGCRLALLLLLPSCRACLAFFLSLFMYSTNSHSLY